MKKSLFKALHWTFAVAFLSLLVTGNLSLIPGYDYLFGHGDSNILQNGFGGAVAYSCQNLQTELVKYYGKNAPQFRTLGSTALIKWLLSPQNTAGFEKIDVESIPGKKRGVAFMVESPMCFTLCKTGLACDEDPEVFEPADQEIVFDLEGDPFRHCDNNGDPVVLQFTEEDLMKYCKNDDTTWIRNKIIRYLFRFEEALDQALTTLLQTELGRNGKNEALTNIPIFTSANQFNPDMSVLNPEAMWYLNQTYMDIGMDGQFAMIGGAIVNKILQFNKWTGLNAAGVDMSKVSAVNPYPFYDRNFETTFGEKDFIVLAPGATQFVTWNKYKGEKNRSVTNLYTKSTVVLPTTGLEVDYKWYYDYKCEKWTFEAFLFGELATVLKGGCGANLANVNGIFQVHDCSAQPIVPACPEAPQA